MAWWQNKKRDARTCGVDQGTVSNIISDLRQKLGNEDAEALRELGSNLKRTGIDAGWC